MDDAERYEVMINGVRLGIAMAKIEIDELIGETTIDSLDDGSPWGRAFLKSQNFLQTSKIFYDLEYSPDEP